MVESELDGDADVNSKYMDKYEIICDMGEGFGHYTIAPDEEIMKYIDAANIACGFHAGDFNTMREMVRLAKKYKVKIGSHPGFPDRMGFGRRKMEFTAEEVYNMVVYQTGALQGYLQMEGMKLNHMNPHGELDFYISTDEKLMEAFVRAAKGFGVPVVATKSKTFSEIAKRMGVDVIQEHFVDIDWKSDGTLNSVQNSIRKSPQDVYDRICQSAQKDTILTKEGEELTLNYGDNPILLCLHTDIPAAIDNIKMARKAIDMLNG